MHNIEFSPIYLYFCLSLHENVHFEPTSLPFVQFISKFLSSDFKEGHFGASEFDHLSIKFSVTSASLEFDRICIKFSVTSAFLMKQSLELVS